MLVMIMVSPPPLLKYPPLFAHTHTHTRVTLMRVMVYLPLL